MTIDRVVPNPNSLQAAADPSKVVGNVQPSVDLAATAARIARGEISRRNSHAGIPSSSMGGAAREIRVCWTMCTDSR